MGGVLWVPMLGVQTGGQSHENPLLFAKAIEWEGRMRLVLWKGFAVLAVLSGVQPTEGQTERTTRTVEVLPLTSDSLISVTHWHHGYLPRYVRRPAGTQQVVWAHDSEGGIHIQRTPIWFQDTYSLDIQDSGDLSSRRQA